MTISYTGKLELYQKQQEKLEVKYAKISKMLDAAGKGDRQAHVILNRNRGQHQVEITVNYLDHSLVGAGVDGEQYNALLTAVEHLEKQIIKVRDRRRDSKSGLKEVRERRPPMKAVAAEASGSTRRQARQACESVGERQTRRPDLSRGARRPQADDGGRSRAAHCQGRDRISSIWTPPPTG